MTDRQETTRSRDPMETVLSLVRGGALLGAVLLMVWLAFNVSLPSVGQLRDWIDGFGWGSRLVFIAAYAVVALTPIPVTVMAVTGGVLFGVVEGSLLSVVGAVIGCLGAYWVARGLGKDTVLRLLGRHREAIEEQLASAGFAAVFTLRVLPGLPYWPINYGAGALGVAYREFAVATMIASVPGQVSLVAVGAFAATPDVVHAIVVALAWAVVVIMTIWAWRVWRGTSSRPLPGSGRVSAGR